MPNKFQSIPCLGRNVFSRRIVIAGISIYGLRFYARWRYSLRGVLFLQFFQQSSFVCLRSFFAPPLREISSVIRVFCTRSAVFGPDTATQLFYKGDSFG